MISADTSTISWPIAVSVAFATSVALFLGAEKLSALSRAAKDRKVREKLAKEGSPPSVAIIGGGFGALATIKRCQELGLRYKIYEKRADIGGTWFQNSCRLGIPRMQKGN
jgi:hypothetical protein